MTALVVVISITSLPITPITPVNWPDRVFDDVFADRIAERLPGFTIRSKMNATEDASVYYLFEGCGKAGKTAHLARQRVICDSDCRVVSEVI